MRGIDRRTLIGPAGRICYTAMPPRMKDIALDLGVSIVTVSKVIRNHPDIAEETRARVLQRVKELDYRPNVLARSLVTGRSYLIGLVVPDLLHPFFAEIEKALSTAVRARGYSLIISSSEEDMAIEAREIEQLLARRLDALVIALTGPSPDVLERIDRMEQPYVLIDRAFPGLASNFVGVDDHAAGRLATQHLIDQGCRTIKGGFPLCGGCGQPASWRRSDAPPARAAAQAGCGFLLQRSLGNRGYERDPGCWVEDSGGYRHRRLWESTLRRLASHSIVQRRSTKPIDWRAHGRESCLISSTRKRDRSRSA